MNGTSTVKTNTNQKPVLKFLRSAAIDIKILKLDNLQLIMDMFSCILAGKPHISQINILARYYGQYNVMANRIAWINSGHVCPSLLNFGHLYDSFKIQKHISSGIKTLTNGKFWCTDTGYLDVPCKFSLESSLVHQRCLCAMYVNYYYVTATGIFRQVVQSSLLKSCL